jgi:site-specific recombinase XerD
MKTNFPATEKKNSVNLFVDYKPAEIQKGNKNQWYIVYYCNNPFAQKLQRVRHRVSKIEPIRERERYAKKICLEINEKLLRGWNPFLEAKNIKRLSTLVEVIDAYVKSKERDKKSDSIREDTLRAYTSFANLFKNWLTKNNYINYYTTQFDRRLITNYLDHIYIEKELSARTHNNHLNWIRNFGKHLVNKSYISVNPVDNNFKSMRVGQKQRENIKDNALLNISNHIKEANLNYWLLCQFTFSLFIRRTEITKLKVENVFLKEGYILIPSDISKNRKTEPVTIVNELIPLIENHIKDASSDCYIFSENNFEAGLQVLEPKKISDQWAKFRKQLDLPASYKFYSLKDTGITKLLNDNIPSIKVRDQARHYDLSITEKYTPRNKGKDTTIAEKGNLF